MSMKTIVFDLDHTLCIPQTHADTQRRYAEAAPIPEMIDFLRECYARGAIVIIFTARRMLTHKGDLTKIEGDVGEVTRDWLAKHDVPYTELIFGKPYGDFYIDDKAVNSDELLEALKQS